MGLSGLPALLTPLGPELQGFLSAQLPAAASLLGRLCQQQRDGPVATAHCWQPQATGPFEDHRLTSTEAVEAVKAAHGVATTPEIFSGTERIGGYTDLAARLGVRPQTADISYTLVVVVFGTASLITVSLNIGISGFMGLGILLRPQPTNLAALVGAVAVGLGAMGMVSVGKAVFIDHLALNCACVGGNSKTPLGVVSFAENLIMALMGVVMLLR